MSRILFGSFYLIALVLLGHFVPQQAVFNNREIAAIDPDTPEYKLTAEEGHYFEQKIKEEAFRYYDDFKKRAPNLERSTYESVVVFTINKYREFKAFRELIASYGKRALRPVVIFSICSNLIVPSVATLLDFMGVPGALWVGGISLAFPHEFWFSPLAFYYKTQREKKDLALRLSLTGPKELEELDQLRSRLLGFEVKHHITSVIYKQFQEEKAKIHRVNIVRQYQNRAQQSGALSIEDLERIVLSEGELGKKYLDDIYPDRPHPTIYTQKLLIFIGDHPTAVKKVIEQSQLLFEKASPNPAHDEARRLLIYIDVLEKDLRHIQNEFLNSAKKVKLKEAWQKNALQNFIVRRTQEYDTKRINLQRIAYSFLKSLQQSHSALEIQESLNQVREKINQDRELLKYYQSSAESGLPDIEKLLSKEQELGFSGESQLNYLKQLNRCDQILYSLSRNLKGSVP